MFDITAIMVWLIPINDIETNKLISTQKPSSQICLVHLCLFGCLQCRATKRRQFN